MLPYILIIILLTPFAGAKIEPLMLRKYLFWIAFCHATFALAQQPLNFDFEKPGAEGLVRPWGWAYYPVSADIKIGMDSTVKRNGKYSLNISGKGASKAQTISYQIEPYALAGKTIRLEAWIRTERLNGAAFFTLDYTRGEDWVSDTSNVKFSGTTTWSLAKLETTLPVNCNWFSLSICHFGEGVAWFDDLVLRVDGKAADAVEIAPAFSKKQVQWLEDSASPLKTVDALPPGAPAAFDDLNAFGAIAGDAKIIALGEATHGTSEFFRLKHRLLSYAVEKLGVRIFAIEDNQLVVERVNNYVLNGVGTARGSMYGMFSVWQNQEVLELIKWLRAYNVQHPDDKVAFRGFDMQNLALPIDSLSRFLKQRDPALLETVSKLLAGLKKDGANSWSASDSTKYAWFVNARQASALVNVRKQTWLSGARTRQDSLNIEWGIQYANLVRQYAENAMKGHESLYRDVAMAENITWLFSIYPPGTRMLVWAHDNHISRGEHPVAEKNYYNGISMGAHLSKKYGTAYRAFGIFTYEGSYRAQPNYMDFSQITCPLLPGPRGTLDEALHQVALRKKSPGLLLDLRNARQQDWLAAPLPIRFANHVSVEYSYWTRFSIPFQYDGLLFVDQTTAAKAASNE